MPFAPPVAGLPGLEEINNFLKTKGTDAAAKGQGYVQGEWVRAFYVETALDAVEMERDDQDEQVVLLTAKTSPKVLTDQLLTQGVPARPLNMTAIEVGGGVSTSISKRLDAYAKVSYATAIDGNYLKAVTGRLGFRLVW